MLKTYIVYFKYKQPGDKKHGPVRHHRVYANSLEDARRQVELMANYPDLEILEIRSA
ncbi:MAG: hypothetical protein ACPGXK_04425 [Phycisphaerae bacterium]